jgi:hypothetical protein
MIPARSFRTCAVPGGVLEGFKVEVVIVVVVVVIMDAPLNADFLIAVAGDAAVGPVFGAF